MEYYIFISKGKNMLPEVVLYVVISMSTAWFVCKKHI